MPTNPTSGPDYPTRDGGHAHATDADLTGARRDSEKDPDTPRPGEGTKTQSETKEESSDEELGHS